MPDLKMKGFTIAENDFSKCRQGELLRHFHQYGFKDKEGRDLVASEDFVSLVTQFCSAQRQPVTSAAERVLYEHVTCSPLISTPRC